jgi:hypothetical protein
LNFRRGRRRSWEPVASYQCCIIFRTDTYFPIQITIVKNRPGLYRGFKPKTGG